jgi:hypothetical protein
VGDLRGKVVLQVQKCLVGLAVKGMGIGRIDMGFGLRFGHQVLGA